MAQHRILVADDSATVRIRVRRILESAGYDVVTASNGLEAMHLLLKDPPLLAILDIAMPYVDGFVVSHEMQKMGSPWNRIPVIFLTMTESHALEVLGDKLGAYLHKPAEEEDLLREVARLHRQCEPEPDSPVTAD